MRYFIECPACGKASVIEQDRVPTTCGLCGSTAPKITLENTKARRRAREAMVKLDELKPRVMAARQAYMDLLMEYEVECQIIRAYSRRGIVTPEEKDRYMFRKSESLSRMTLAENMKKRGKK